MDYQSRIYDPALGRFVQPDTIIPDPADPQLFNRYSYVSNSPTNRTDPTGHCDEWNDVDKSCYGALTLPKCTADMSAYEPCDSSHEPAADDMVPGGKDKPDQLNRSKLSKRANVLYDMYLIAFNDPNGWWQTTKWQDGYFSIWDYMAIFWNYEKAGLGNNQKMIASQINRAPDYCAHQCSTAADNLNYLSIFAQAARIRIKEYTGQNIETVLDMPAGDLQPGLDIINGIRHSAEDRAINGINNNSPYDYGNVSLNVGLYTYMIRMGWTVFHTDLSEGGDTFFILSYCQSEAAQDAQQNYHGELSGALYNSWCQPSTP